jgi:hypothetical protein
LGDRWGSGSWALETITTRQADFKRRVHVRMAKTGESYAAARIHVLAERPGVGGEVSATALHVTNGDSTVPALRGTGLARHILTWRDARRPRHPTCGSSPKPSTGSAANIPPPATDCR